MSSRPLSTYPLAIAHRAGNGLARVTAAAAAGADVIEADVWFQHGRLEVRHPRTLGPLPFLWEKWKLTPAWRPRLLLADLLSEWPADVELMVDMKGHEPAFPDALARELQRLHPGRPVTFSARTWDYLDALEGYPDARFLPSAGSQAQLDALLSRFRTHHTAATIHLDVVTAENVRSIREAGGEVVTWPVNTRRDLDRVLNLGAGGVISDSLPLLRHLVGVRDRTGASAAG